MWARLRNSSKDPRSVTSRGHRNTVVPKRASIRAAVHGIFGYALMSCATVRDGIEVGTRFFDLTFAFSRAALEYAGDEVRFCLDDRHVPAQLRGFLLERDVDACGGSGRAGVGPAHADREPGGRRRTAAGVRGTAAAQTEPRRARRPRAGSAAAPGRGGPHAGPGGRDAGGGGGPRTGRSWPRRWGTMAGELLDAGLPVERVAHRLGYADASSFSVAFQRWTGRTPGGRGWERRSV
ncbi:hypothetical protein CEJ39_14705 [Rhodococcus pyridinivorans]|nr:hypothetical protein CEJ39_14705 [Rhodococcus pyridinivorans]